MPIYEYENPVTGEVRDAFREVRDRDHPPAPGFFRRSVPSRVAIVNGGAVPPGDAIHSLEKAWKHAENSGDLARARKEGRITVSTRLAKERMRHLREHTAAAQAATPWLQRSSQGTTPGLEGLTRDSRTTVHKPKHRRSA